MLDYMLKTQERLNTLNFPDWRSRNLDWDTAILVESAELVEHLEWKWWKTTSSDLPQARMEVVDLWHFWLSKVLQDLGTDQAISVYSVDPSLAIRSIWREQESALPASVDPTIVAHRVKCFVRASLSKYGVEKPVCDIHELLALMNSMQMTFREVFVLFVGKAELNQLRWDNGYGTTYVKTWFGKEDNEVLAEVISSLDASSVDFPEKVKLELSRRYQEVRQSIADYQTVPI